MRVVRFIGEKNNREVEEEDGEGPTRSLAEPRMNHKEDMRSTGKMNKDEEEDDKKSKKANE